MFTDLNRPPLNQSELRRGLVQSDSSDGGAPLFYSSLDLVDRTGSTNADLLERTDDPEADRSVLIAEFQGSGRGRHSRSWVSPPQAQIALSMLLRLPGIEPAALGWLPLLTGIAVCDTLRAVAKVDATLKWPNDVLIDGRKVAGILAEVGSTSIPAVVVGLGLNVSLTVDELPVPTATSLQLVDAEVTDRTTLTRSVLRDFAARFAAWERGGWATDELAVAYRERCSTLGARVSAELPGGAVVAGTARDVDDQGRLLIAVPDTDTVAVTAGDVTHLRPAGPQESGQ